MSRNSNVQCSIKLQQKFNERHPLARLDVAAFLALIDYLVLIEAGLFDELASSEAQWHTARIDEDC